jgi:cell division septation protein DedD
MTPNPEEKELVLGNRQLLSFFFVVVALCGVFFAIGYIIGRNTAKTAVVAEASGTLTTAGEGQPSPLPAPPPAVETPAPQPATVETRPAPQATQPTSQQATTPAARPNDTPAVNPNRIVPVATPEKGASYLQVTALPRSDAEAVVRTLKEQGFPAIMTESSRDGFFRVLVGPYREATQLSTGKDRLRALGFANTIVHKEP